MAKKSEKAVIPVNTGIDSYEATKVLFTEIAAQVVQIKVTDTTTLAIANQKMSTVNNHLKEIEAKRVEQKAPHMAAAKAVDDIAKELKALLEPALAHVKKEVATWETERIRKENELKQKALDEARKAEDEAKGIAEHKRITEYMVQVKNWLENQLTVCDSIESCSKMLESIKGLPAAFQMGNYQTEYTSLVEMYTKLFRTKLGEYEGKIAKGTTENHIQVLGGQLNSHIDSLKEQVESKEQESVVVNTEIVEQMAALQDDKASNVAFLWKFEVIDESLVPNWLMSVDDKKVNEWKNANKDSLKNGETIMGIRFYQEASVRTK